MSTSRSKKQISKNSFELLPCLNHETSRELVDKVLEKEGRIDVLINNAGAQHLGPIEETAPSAIQSHFTTNLFGPLGLIESITCDA